MLDGQTIIRDQALFSFQLPDGTDTLRIYSPVTRISKYIQIEVTHIENPNTATGYYGIYLRKFKENFYKAEVKSKNGDTELKVKTNLLILSLPGTTTLMAATPIFRNRINS